MEKKDSTRPHVLIFPYPYKAQSTLCLSSPSSFVSPVFTSPSSSPISYTRAYSVTLTFTLDSIDTPDFASETISDGLPEDHPRGDRIMELFDSLKTNTKPLFKELLTTGSLGSDKGRPITCIIADGIMGFTCDVANEIGIPIIYVRTISACCLWVFFCLPNLIEAGELPFNGDDLDTPIKSVPGTENSLRIRDLPSFCRSGDICHPSIQLYKTERQELRRAYGLILNTFEDLEGPILSQMRTVCPNLYPIGPLHTHLKTKLAAESTSPAISSNSLWKEDKSCITWLDSQPPKSVIYVSFGSLAIMTRDQLMEFWHGLVNSGCKFLWVIRPDSVAGDSQIPAEVAEGTKERGYIVGWAPQEEVLAHPSVGGFLTHSGWNSTLESVIEGKPMICWPYFMDQQVNSRFVEEFWKLGLDMKDTCDRVIFEKMVKDLMVERRDEFMKSADQMARLGKKCLSEGGSSYCNLDRLIEDIKLMGVER